jgi:hypothetical protein
VTGGASTQCAKGERLFRRQCRRRGLHACSDVTHDLCIRAIERRDDRTQPIL